MSKRSLHGNPGMAVEPTLKKAHFSFWIISSILLIWGLAYACLVFFSFFFSTPEDTAALVANGTIKQEYADYIARIPTWVVGTSVLAAITRLFAAVGLLLRRSWSVVLYGISLLCVTIIMFRAFVLADVARVIRPSQVGVEIVFMALSIFAVWYSATQHSNKMLT